jgi:hypothetical protein
MRQRVWKGSFAVNDVGVKLTLGHLSVRAPATLATRHRKVVVFEIEDACGMWGPDPVKPVDPSACRQRCGLGPSPSRWASATYSSRAFPVPSRIERRNDALRACLYEALLVVPGNVMQIDVFESHVAVLMEPLEMAMNV